ncbi:MAG: hypothetical protein FJ125_06605, partial [Deltaproteobacteria bacterium]|nr:hypothetical protein [Deltaproteobacteria bacterium]
MGAGEALIVAACGEPSRRRVCGLDPVLRAVLAGQQSGLQHVVVVAAAGEHALWSRRLVDHPRLRLRLLLLTPEEALARGSGLLPDGAEEAVVACADTIRLPALLRTMLP